MNLPAAISPTTTSFADARKSPGAGVLARERAKDELRHRHVGGRLDPVARDVAEDDGEPAVAELDEVVDVASDVDARRRLVDLADLETAELRVRTRQQRALHRVGEFLLLLVQAAVVDRERRLRGDRERGLEALTHDRAERVERDDGQRRHDLAGCRDREDRRRRALLEERREQPVRAAELVRELRLEDDGATGAEEPLDGERIERLRPDEHRPYRGLEARVTHVIRTRRQQLAPRVGHADHGSVHVEQLRGASRERLERRLEREALSERLRDLVQRAKSPRGLALGGERAVACGREHVRALVEARVVDGDRELRRERREQGLVVIARRRRPASG